MTCNMGNADRLIRTLLVAPILVVVGVLAGPAGVLAYVLYALAGVMLVTGLFGYCPLYSLFKVDTRARDRVSV